MGHATTADGLRFGMDFLKRYHSMKRGYWAPNQTSTWKCNGEKTGEINYTLNLSHENPYLELDYRWRGEPVKYRIEMVCTCPNYGGERWWFICPFTKKRCRVLYSPYGQRYFASQKAFGLKYPSQNESKWDRVMSRFHKKKDQYGSPDWCDGAWFPKPKGMHLKTYNRRIEELEELEARVDARFLLLGSKMAGMTGLHDEIKRILGQV